MGLIMSSPRLMTILFADVAGSVDLYSELGDELAHQNINKFQQSLSVLIEEAQGRVIEIIGDEIMCAFDNADNAFSTACRIQENLSQQCGQKLNVRIGFHSGITSEQDNHPFGDTVNLAARVVAIAKAGQIMLTDQAMQYLNTDNKMSTCLFNKVSIKGKREPYTIHQAIWDQDDITMISFRKPSERAELRQKNSCIELQYENVTTTVANGAEVLIGRGEQCQMRINSEFASRVHATIKYVGGKMILCDRSANGTYIKTRQGNRADDNIDLFLSQDEWTTTSDGVISLGELFSDDESKLIHFKLHSGGSSASNKNNEG